MDRKSSAPPAPNLAPYEVDKVHPADAPYIATTHRGRHTAIVFYKGTKNLRFLALDAGGMAIQYWPIDKFQAEYGVMVGYPLKKAVDHYKRAAAEFGATAAVQAALEQLSNGAINVAQLDAEENVMAKAKTKAKESKKATKKAAAATNGSGEKKQRGGLGSFIMDLVMAGKLTDADIVTKAQAQFPKNKVGATYPSWYRSKLKKDGKNPPEAVKAKE